MGFGKWGKMGSHFRKAVGQMSNFNGNRNVCIILGKRDHMHGSRRGTGGRPPLENRK